VNAIIGGITNTDLASCGAELLKSSAMVKYRFDLLQICFLKQVPRRVEIGVHR